jgi:signal transduction histidine kinase
MNSIGKKLIAVTLAMILIPVFATLVLVAEREIRDIREDMISSSALMSSVVAEYGAAAMAFDDRAAAEQALQVLGRHEEFLDAELYDLTGRLFAAYRHDSKAPPPTESFDGLARASAALEGAHIKVVRPVDHGGTRYGTLVLHTSTEPLASRVREYLWGLMWLTVGLLAASIMLAWLLERMVSRRLRKLAEVAGGVAQKGDYTVRAGDGGGDEIGLLASAFNRMLSEIERRQDEALKAVRVRDEFLSIASHELKTPLTSLKLQVQGLLEQPPPIAEREEAERLKSSFALTERQVRRLERLIGNLLDVSRIAVGRFLLQLEEVDLVRVVRDVAAQFSAELARSRTQLSLILPSEVLGKFDPLRIEQVVVNLLSNALKYGNGKPIELTLEAKNGRARLSIRDGGIGVDPEHHQRIFERFERAVSLNYGGLGLGLYITRQIVQAHGGTIEVESRLGAGSIFTVEIPRKGPTT